MTTTNEAKNVRLPIEVYDRLKEMKYSWETWGSFLNRMIPERKIGILERDMMETETVKNRRSEKK